MTWNSKVIWSEGMFLQPQHFQQQDRYVEHLVEGRTRPLTRFAWGFTRLEIDAAALALGLLQINSAAGILPDGTPFDVPASDPPPAALQVDPMMKDEAIVLALPVRRRGTVDVDTEGGTQQLVRFGTAETDCVDSTSSQGRGAVVQVGQLRLRLLRERDAVDGYCKLAVAEVQERKPDNTVILSRQFIAPMLAVDAHPVLAAMLADIHGRVHQLGEALAVSLGQPGRGGIGEIAEFLMLQTVNRHEPRLLHMKQVATLHPEELFVACLDLAGDLSIFSATGRRPHFAFEYRQDDLEGSFAPLLSELRRLLSQRPEQSAVPIELQEKRFGVRVAVVNDPELLESASFVFAVNAQLPTEALRARFPTQVKVGPSERIRDLVNLQLPGIPLRTLAVAPRQVPFHAGYAYFELERGSDLWKQFQKSGNLAMHVAGEFPGLEMACWAIRAA